MTPPPPWQALFAGKKLAEGKHAEHHHHNDEQGGHERNKEEVARVELKCENVEAAVEEALSENAILARPPAAHVASHAALSSSSATRSSHNDKTGALPSRDWQGRPRSLLVDDLDRKGGYKGTARHPHSSETGMAKQSPDMAVGQLADPSKDEQVLHQAQGRSRDAAASSSNGNASELWNIFGGLFGTTYEENGAPKDVQLAQEEESFLGAASRLRSMLDQDSSPKDTWLEKQRSEVDRALRSASVSSSSSGGDGDGSHGTSSDSSTANLREQTTYLSPRLPLVFCHGLFGFDTFSLAPAALAESLPSFSVDYWRGIVDVLQRRGNEVLVCRVPMSASIEERAKALREMIEAKYPEREINLIGHSMGGLDCRYLITNLKTSFRVRSLTTIATPHRGSTFADYMLDELIGKERMPTLLNLLEKTGLPGGGRAFECLTTTAMKQFNTDTPDIDTVRYFSWGAAFRPGVFHEFRIPHGIILEREVRTPSVSIGEPLLTDTFLPMTKGGKRRPGQCDIEHVGNVQGHPHSLAPGSYWLDTPARHLQGRRRRRAQTV